MKDVITVNWNHVGSWLYGFCGVAGGLIASPLLFDFPSTSGWASAFGAAVGASITVAGAFLVTKSSEVRARLAIRGVAKQAIKAVEKAWLEVDEAHKAIQELLNTGQQGKIDAAAADLTLKFSSLAMDAAVVLQQMNELKPVYHASGPIVAIAHFHISSSIRDIKVDSDKVTADLRNNGYGRIAQPIALAVHRIRSSYQKTIEYLATI